jgi:hypothetical protein
MGWPWKEYPKDISAEKKFTKDILLKMPERLCFYGIKEDRCNLKLHTQVGAESSIGYRTKV